MALLRCTKLLTLISLLFLSQTPLAGYLGTSASINASANIDKQDNGFRINFGSDTTSWLDLEWSYVDYGQSSFNDPEFSLADEDNPDDVDQFKNFHFGSQYVNDETAEFSGLAHMHTRGLSAGLKFKKNLTNWLDIYARASLMAWETTSIPVSIYAPRAAHDEDGNPLTDSDNSEAAANLNPCGTLNFCRIEDTGNPVQTWAVDFWYGYGTTIKPFDWLAIRAEYSVITLNAVDFPNATLESFSAGLEIYY